MLKWLARDWAQIVVSVLLAVGLWYYAVGEEDIEVTRVIPLEIKLKNDQMSILSTSARMIQVTFMCPRALLSDLTSEQIRAVHEIGGEAKTAGEYSFRIEPREINLRTPQIRVTKIEPEVVRATLDEVIVQKLAVKPNFVGDPAFGYKVSQEDIQLDPNAILIEGPKGSLEKMDSVSTERIDLVGRIRAFRRTVTLDLPSNLKPLSEALIDIYIPIKEESAEKPFENVPVKVLKGAGAEGSVEIKNPLISFVLKGSKRGLDKLSAEKILAYVDVSNLPPGEHLVPVDMILPEDIRIRDDQPVRVQVAVKK